jgi:hypothetical protein
VCLFPVQKQLGVAAAAAVTVAAAWASAADDVCCSTRSTCCCCLPCHCHRLIWQQMEGRGPESPAIRYTGTCDTDSNCVVNTNVDVHLDTQKHLTWPISTCVRSRHADLNQTRYEAS